MSNRGLTWVIFFICLIAATVRLEWLLRPGTVQARAREQGTLRHFEELIRERYVDEVDEDKLFYGGLSGMASSLDRYSVFWPPRTYKDEQDNNEGHFGGVGLEIKGLVITTPVRGTPAWRAGIWPEDRLVKINGKLVRSFNPDDISSLLRGPEKTAVLLEVERDQGGKTETREMNIIRDQIRLQSVREALILKSPLQLAARVPAGGPKIGYVRVQQFQRDTPQDLELALDDLEAQGMEALVIDLRQNPGGLLDAAVEICDLFINAGVIVTTRERSTHARKGREEIHRAQPDKRRRTYPLALLIDGHSASASEIVSGCLKDHQRAVLVGTKSYGKGLVQSIIPLDLGERGDGALKITTAKYYTPSGVCIDGQGIRPDYEVPFTTEQLDKMLDERIKRHLLENDPRRDPAMNPDAPRFIEEQEKKAREAEEKRKLAGKVEEPFYDLQLEKAIQVLREPKGSPLPGSDKPSDLKN